MAKNDITGDNLVSRANSKAYSDNYGNKFAEKIADELISKYPQLDKRKLYKKIISFKYDGKKNTQWRNQYIDHVANYCEEIILGKTSE